MRAVFWEFEFKLVLVEDYPKESAHGSAVFLTTSRHVSIFFFLEHLSELIENNSQYESDFSWRRAAKGAFLFINVPAYFLISFHNFLLLRIISKAWNQITSESSCESEALQLKLQTMSLICYKKGMRLLSSIKRMRLKGTSRLMMVHIL